MKQLIILTFLFFMFTACEKSAGDLTANGNSASVNENTEAVAAGKLVFTFNVNAQGWKTEGGARLLYAPTGGNPGGCIAGKDNSSATYWYFIAPPALLTAIRSKTANGNFKLNFDLKAPSSNNTNEPDVIIVSPDATLVANIANDPNNTAFTSFSIPFTKAGGWKFNTLNGTPATLGQIKKALHTITKLAIRGEFDVAAGNTGLLDNVSASPL